MVGILEKNEAGWVVRWSGLRWDQWVSTPLQPTAVAKILTLEDDAISDLEQAVWARVNKLRDAGKLHTGEIDEEEPSALAFTPYDIKDHYLPESYPHHITYYYQNKKAHELVDKFSNECLLTTDGGKIAALIAVNEIINAVDEWAEDNYWQEVKQEIEKL